jgi:beta-lactamase class C
MSVPAVTLALALLAISVSSAFADDLLQRVVLDETRDLLPANQAGGVAVAIVTSDRTRFFDQGFADRAKRRPMNRDCLFNIASLRKPFEAILLAEAVGEGRMALDDPVSRYVPDLVHGRDIRHVTVGQLATHTSGLLLPQDHPPWPTAHYTRSSFIEALNAWQADSEQQPGRQHMYTHAGYILLQLALEKGLGAPIDELIATRIVGPLGMMASLIPARDKDGRAELPPRPVGRTVQGYSAEGEPIGAPGDQQTYYDFPGTGQMYSSAHDLARFISANMHASSLSTELAVAMRDTVVPKVMIAPHHAQALAWEVNTAVAPPIVEKNGGLNNSSTYMAFMPSLKLGIVVLSNRGDQDVAEAGRRIFRALAHHRS